MTKQKAVLWDLDGTIIDSLTTLHETFNHALPKVGLAKVERERVRQELHGPYADIAVRISDNYADQEELLRHLFEVQLVLHENLVSHEGIHDAIEDFAKSGFKQAIVTSRPGGPEGDKTGAHTIVKTIKLDLHIELVISADEVEHLKPHPEPILKALEILGVDPADAVMIGDQPVDVQAAKAAGVKSILIDHEQTPESRAAAEAAMPDLLCTNATEIIDGVHQFLGL